VIRQLFVLLILVSALTGCGGSGPSKYQVKGTVRVNGQLAGLVRVQFLHTDHGRYVLFVTGKEESAALVLLDAKEVEPKPITISLNVEKGSKALTPVVGTTPEGKAYAFVFHDHDKDVDVEDALSIVALDPDGDGDCKDAKVVKMLKVGKSAVEGHFGHHDLAFDADKRFAFFTNPGDGTISALSLKTLEVVATYEVGGMPTHLVARGGKETDD